MTQPAYLMLSSGECFKGFVPDWQRETIFGELVFNTSMVGYVEAMTDPSYAGQSLTFTYPLIGNYGVPDPKDWESPKIQAAAIIVSDAVEFYSHHQAQRSLLEWCRAENIPVMFGVDTRALAKKISRDGVCPAAISLTDKMSTAFRDINTEHLVKQVSISKFEETGLFESDAGLAFLENILEMGGSEDMKVLYRKFRGRDATIDALLRHSGIVE